MVQRLDSILPNDRLLTPDGGHFNNWILDGITIPSPADYHQAGIDFGSIGIGIPTGLGAAMTTKTQTPIIFCGDAGLMLTLQEIETAARKEIPVIMIVMNDDALGSEYYAIGNTVATRRPRSSTPPTSPRWPRPSAPKATPSDR